MKTSLCFGLAALLLGAAAVSAPAQDKPADKPKEPDPVQLLGVLMLDQKNSTPEVRRAAAFALKYYPQAEDVVNAAVLALADPDDVVRDNAVDALVLMTPKATVTPLRAALNAKDPVVRRHAAMALGRIRRYTEDAVPALVFLLKDKDQDVRQAAAQALKSIHGSRREY